MATADKATQDKKMAAFLRAKGIERDSGRCPICNRVISMKPFAAVSSALYHHIVTCR